MNSCDPFGMQEQPITVPGLLGAKQGEEEKQKVFGAKKAVLPPDFFCFKFSLNLQIIISSL